MARKTTCSTSHTALNGVWMCMLDGYYLNLKYLGYIFFVSSDDIMTTKNHYRTSCHQWFPLCIDLTKSMQHIPENVKCSYKVVHYIVIDHFWSSRLACRLLYDCVRETYNIYDATSIIYLLILYIIMHFLALHKRCEWWISMPTHCLITSATHFNAFLLCECAVIVWIQHPCPKGKD